MGELGTLIGENVKSLIIELGKLVENAVAAQKLAEETFEAGPPIQLFKHELSRKYQRLRPSIGRISLVSFHPHFPQMGPYQYRWTISDASRLRKALVSEVLEPGREVPEKRLQSWLIREAAINGHVLRPLNEVLGGEYWFVSDELAIKVGKSNKVVADMLLVRVEDGRAQLVNVELKSKRSRSEVFEQVISFREVIEHESLVKLWRQFAEAMTGRNFSWDDSLFTRGIVLWPGSKKPKKAQMTERVDEVWYTPIGDAKRPSGYTLALPVDASL